MERLQYIGDRMKDFYFKNPITGVPYHFQERAVKSAPQKFNEEAFMDMFALLKRTVH